MKTLHWILILIVLTLFAPISSKIDQFITQAFYSNGFYLENHPFFTFFYQYGEWPALIFAALALACFFISFISSFVRPYRNDGLYLFLVLLTGAALMTNMILKEHWGRPRPKQTDLYGGTEPFRPFYAPQFNHSNNKSFPSGHCTMGFYFYALMVIGRKRKNKLFFFTGATIALFLGGALSLTRIAQGGHYFSDTLFAALIMIAFAEALSYLIPTKTPSC